MSNILKCAFHKSTNSRDGSGRRVCRRESFEICEFFSGRETVLKPEQESAVRALLADRDVLAVLPTRYYKSLIYQMFVRVKNYELNGNAAILVISPLKSIIEDQLQEMDLLGYPAKDLANLSNDDIRRCNFKIAFATAEKVKEKPFRAMLVDSKSKLHRNVSAILVDESLNSVDSAILTASKLCALISGCLNAILAAVFQLRRARF